MNPERTAPRLDDESVPPLEPEPVVPERFQQVLDGGRVTCLRCGYPMVIDGTAHDQTMASIATWRRGYPDAPIPHHLLRLVMKCFSNGHQEVWHATPPEIRLEPTRTNADRVEVECGCGKLFISIGKAEQCSACRGRSSRLWKRTGHPIVLPA
jgi:hypothetical protein